MNTSTTKCLLVVSVLCMCLLLNVNGHQDLTGSNEKDLTGLRDYLLGSHDYYSDEASLPLRITGEQEDSDNDGGGNQRELEGDKSLRRYKMKLLAKLVARMSHRAPDGELSHTIAKYKSAEDKPVSRQASTKDRIVKKHPIRHPFIGK